MQDDLKAFNEKNAKALGWLDDKLEWDAIHAEGQMLNDVTNVLNKDDMVRALAFAATALQNNALAVAKLYSEGGKDAVYNDVDSIHNFYDLLKDLKTIMQQGLKLRV